MMKDNSKKQKCDYNNFQRAQYFHGMLMTDRDFIEEQSYHIRKRKLLNRMLHGTGVVCGLKMEPAGCGKYSKIIIRPGLALDCAGNEIFVPESYELDIIEMIKSATDYETGGYKTEVKNDNCGTGEGEGLTEEKKWYIVVRYKEAHTAPVQVYSPTGGCEEKTCEYSRIKEGYCFEVYRSLPENITCPTPIKKDNGKCNEYTKIENDNISIDESKSGDIRQFLCEDLLMPCPDICCDNQPVVLGSIFFKGEDISKDFSKITIDKNMINNWDCRRYVITFGLLQHWLEQLAPAIFSLDILMNYPLLKDACKNEESAVSFFEEICNAGKVTLDKGNNNEGK